MDLNTPADPDAAGPASATVPAGLAPRRLFRRVLPFLWPAAAIAATLAFILVKIDPFAAPPPDPDADDVSIAWSNSIARLGIQPIFPPEEDVYVGDLWAVIVSAEGDTRTLLGRSVRIAHIDMRAEILNGQRGKPVFGETTDLRQGESLRRQDRMEAPEGPPVDRIGLRLAGFPGITIRHSSRSHAGVNGPAGRAGAERDSAGVEEIQIRDAETYGVTVVEGFSRLDAFCTAPETATYCLDAFARRALAFGIDTRVLDQENGVYKTKLQLRLITRLYVTREIVQRRTQENSLGAGAGVPLAIGRAAPPAAAPRPAADDAATGDARSRAQMGDREAGVQSAAGDIAGAAALVVGANGVEVGLRQTFLRPVAFGFRAVTIEPR